jgi:sugar lactone lactonase YvrE
MIIRRDDVSLHGEGLDHPECVAVDANGTLWAGGEGGQIYEIVPGGSQRQVAAVGGFVLGIALDGNGGIHACDYTRRVVWLIERDGMVTQRTSGAPKRPFVLPNYAVFDRDGNLYVSDSGDYWHPTGDGAILKISPSNETTVFHDGPFRFANGMAIDPRGNWLYVVQTTAADIVRVPIHEPNGPIEVTHRFPPGTVPDGIAFAADGRLVIACYKPDAIYVGFPDGRVELLYEDPTGELLNRPTNVALSDGRLYIANLGGWHLTSIPSDMMP